MSRSTHCVGTDGGPLVLIPQPYLLAWEGGSPPSSGRVVQAKFRCDDPDAPATDYDLACDVDGYLGVIPVGAGEGLVVSIDPLPACWWSDEQGRGGVLLRWLHGDGTLNTDQVAASVPEDLWEPTGIRFHIPEGRVYLFDSAYPARELPNMDEDQKLTFFISPGRYSLATALYAPDEENSLVLHRFTPATSPA